MEIILLDEAREKGLTRYFTGDICPKGHVSERMVSNRDCVGCMRERSRRDYQENGDEIRAKSRARMNALYRQDPQRFRDRKKAQYYSDPEHWRAETRRYAVEHPLKIRASQNRRGRTHVPGLFSENDILAKLSDQHGCCNGCGIDIIATWKIDHIVPTSRGGTHWPDNIQLLCRSCNSKKRTRTMEEWLGIKDRQLALL